MEIKGSPYCEECIGALRDEEDRKEKETEEKKKAFRAQNSDKLITAAGVRSRYLHCYLQNFEGRTHKEPPSYIWGPVGVGKTHLAIGYLREELIEHGVEYGRFVRAVDLFKDIRRAFDENSGLTEEDVIRRYHRIPFLVLDDLGTEKVSAWVEQTLYDLIDGRYSDMKQFMITSNLSLTALSEHYPSHGDRLASRIAGAGRVLEIKGTKDRRTKR